MQSSGCSRTCSPGKRYFSLCISDTFYDNLKAIDLVYFMSYTKTLRGYSPQLLLNFERIGRYPHPPPYSYPHWQGYAGERHRLARDHSSPLKTPEF
jgi:hypothetical protein